MFFNGLNKFSGAFLFLFLLYIIFVYLQSPSSSPNTCSESSAKEWLKNWTLESELAFENAELLNPDGKVKVDGTTDDYRYLFQFDSGQGLSRRVIVECAPGEAGTPEFEITFVN